MSCENDNALMAIIKSINQEVKKRIPNATEKTMCKKENMEIVLQIRNKHTTQKPVALMEYLIKTYTNEGETVLDFAAGSGTTGVACANTGRKFIGIEKDKYFFDLASSRIPSKKEPS